MTLRCLMFYANLLKLYPVRYDEWFGRLHTLSIYSKSRSHACLFCVLSHVFSKKRETARSLSETGMKVFPCEHPSPVTRTKLFKQNNFALITWPPKWHNSGLVCISTLGVCELALLLKLPCKSTQSYEIRKK